MFNLGMGEITVIVLLALIFIGPKKLPELASGLGKLIREIRKTTADVKNEIQLDDAIRKPLEELREAVTLHPDELKRRDRIRRDLDIAQREAEAAMKLMAEAAPPEGEATEPAAVGSLGPSDGESIGGATSTTTDSVSAPAAPVISAEAPQGTIPREPSAPRPALAFPAPSAPPASVAPSVPSFFTSPAAASGRPPIDFARTLPGGIDSRRETVKAMAASPGPAESAADRSNTTQALSEADLAAIAIGPPPPPASTRTGRTLPPPPPTLPGATPPKLTFTKSRPTISAPASGPASGPAPAAAATTGPLTASADPEEKKPEPTT